MTEDSLHPDEVGSFRSCRSQLPSARGAALGRTHTCTARQPGASTHTCTQQQPTTAFLVALHVRELPFSASHTLTPGVMPPPPPPAPPVPAQVLVTVSVSRCLHAVSAAGFLRSGPGDMAMGTAVMAQVGEAAAGPGRVPAAAVVGLIEASCLTSAPAARVAPPPQKNPSAPADRRWTTAQSAGRLRPRRARLSLAPSQCPASPRSTPPPPDVPPPRRSSCPAASRWRTCAMPSLAPPTTCWRARAPPSPAPTFLWGTHFTWTKSRQASAHPGWPPATPAPPPPPSARTSLLPHHPAHRPNSP